MSLLKHMASIIGPLLPVSVFLLLVPSPLWLLCIQAAEIQHAVARGTEPMPPFLNLRGLQAVWERGAGELLRAAASGTEFFAEHKRQELLFTPFAPGDFSGHGHGRGLKEQDSPPCLPSETPLLGSSSSVLVPVVSHKLCSDDALGACTKSSAPLPSSPSP